MFVRPGCALRVKSCVGLPPDVIFCVKATKINFDIIRPESLSKYFHIFHHAFFSGLFLSLALSRLQVSSEQPLPSELGISQAFSEETLRSDASCSDEFLSYPVTHFRCLASFRRS